MKEVQWVISEAQLMQMLREVAEGNDPDIVYAAHYANGSHEDYSDRRTD